MNTQQIFEDAAYEAQALTEEISAIADDIQRLVAQREVLVKRLEQLTNKRDVSPVTLRLLPGKGTDLPSSDELPSNEDLPSSDELPRPEACG